MIWQHADEADRSVNVFARAMATPAADRNLIDFSLNAGLNFNEPIWHRDDDVFGIGMGYTHVSSRAAGLDRDSHAFEQSAVSGSRRRSFPRGNLPVSIQDLVAVATNLPVRL